MKIRPFCLVSIKYHTESREYVTFKITTKDGQVVEAYMKMEE